MDFVSVLNNIKDIFVDNWIGQTIWLVAFLVSIYNFTFCKDKKFVFVTMVVSLIWWMHFFSIWLLAAAFVNFVDVFKNALALKYEKSKKLASTFIFFYIIIGFLTFEWYISLIPTISWIVSTFLVFYIRGVWLNIGFMWIIIMWMLYNYTWWSIGWLSTDIVLFFSWIIWIIRIMAEEKKKKKHKIEKEVERDMKREIENL